MRTNKARLYVHRARFRRPPGPPHGGPGEGGGRSEVKAKRGNADYMRKWRWWRRGMGTDLLSFETERESRGVGLTASEEEQDVAEVITKVRAI